MPTKKQKQLNTTLQKFYDNPVSRVSLELFLTIAAVVFFALFAIRPTLLTMSDLVKEIEDKKELNDKLVKKIAALSTAQNQYYSLEPKLEVLDAAIPINPNLIKTLKIIEKIASEQELVINGISVSEVPKKMEITPSFSQLQRLDMSFKVAITGDFSAIKSFVEELQNSRRVFAVSSIIFSVEDNRGAKKLNANITVDAPYFGQ